MNINGESLSKLPDLIDNIPQIDNRGLLRYLIGCGASIALTTQLSRPVSDIDIVMVKLTPRLLDFPDNDVVTPTNFWADMILSAAYLRNTAYWVDSEILGKVRKIAVVHPAITLVQKASAASFLRPKPREKDKEDSLLLSAFLRSGKISCSEWKPIISKSISTLPISEQPRSREIVSNLLKL